VKKIIIMTRKELLNSRAFVTAGIQLDLLNVIEDYIKDNKMSRTDLAKKLKVSKGYISQILSAAYDHKISKLVDLSLSLNKMPIVFFEDLDRFISNDENDKIYELIPVQRPKAVTYEVTNYPMIDYSQNPSYSAPLKKLKSLTLVSQ